MAGGSPRCRTSGGHPRLRAGRGETPAGSTTPTPSQGPVLGKAGSHVHGAVAGMRTEVVGRAAGCPVTTNTEGMEFVFFMTLPGLVIALTLLAFVDQLLLRAGRSEHCRGGTAPVRGRYRRPGSSSCTRVFRRGSRTSSKSGSLHWSCRTTRTTGRRRTERRWIWPEGLRSSGCPSPSGDCAWSPSAYLVQCPPPCVGACRSGRLGCFVAAPRGPIGSGTARLGRAGGREGRIGGVAARGRAVRQCPTV